MMACLTDFFSRFQNVLFRVAEQIKLRSKHVNTSNEILIRSFGNSCSSLFSCLFRAACIGSTPSDGSTRTVKGDASRIMRAALHLVADYGRGILSQPKSPPVVSPAE